MTEEIIKDFKKHQHFVPPGQKAKLKSANARKRNNKRRRMRRNYNNNYNNRQSYFNIKQKRVPFERSNGTLFCLSYKY